MFLGHFAIGLAGKRAAPSVSLGTWIAAVQLVDLIWPIMLLTGLEHVRIVPGITAFTPLDFYDYPITHSLVGGIGWAAAFASAWFFFRRDTRVAALLALGVLSHWFLDVLSHRPDMPVLPDGPYVGVGLWNSISATLTVELTIFAAALLLYIRGGFASARRLTFWLMIGVMVASYFAAAFGPPPPDATTLAVSALAMWLFVLWGSRAERVKGEG